MSETTIVVDDLERAIGEFAAQGFRLEMIVPADEPHAAIVSNGERTIRLESPRLVTSETTRDSSVPLVTRKASSVWHRGRAGMEYRDLIPGRLGGSCVASHIRILNGGETADYVHYHQVKFQLIFCRRGWARLVYQDQGPPFVFEEGDCVLQPPTIRHRVLETSAGFEVVEVSSPAVHETWVEHELALPSPDLTPGKLYGGQPFLLMRSKETEWVRIGSGVEVQDTGIEAATGGLASVQVLKYEPGAICDVPMSGRARLHFVLFGEVAIRLSDLADDVDLRAEESLVTPPSSGITVKALSASMLLLVDLP